MEREIPIASGLPVHCAHDALVSVHELRPHPRNPNEHPEKQLIVYAAAIKARGWRESITVSLRSGPCHETCLETLLGAWLRSRCW